MNEHVPQLKSELMSRLAPGGKMIMTAGWAEGLDVAEVKKYLKNVKGAIDNFETKGKYVGYKGEAIKKMSLAVAVGINKSDSGFEIKNVEKLYDNFFKRLLRWSASWACSLNQTDRRIF